MGEKRKTYDVEFKRKAVQMYLEDKLAYKSIARELGIERSMVRRWVTQYEQEGLTGLEEKRGKASGVNVGRPRTKPMSVEDELVRLRAENEYLKKLWALQRGQSGKGPTNT